MSQEDFPYDLLRILELRAIERELAQYAEPALRIVKAIPQEAAAIGVLAGSFNPLTRGHTALASAALDAGLDAMLLLLPVRAIDKESIARAALYDRALVALEWAQHQARIGMALVNRGLYVEQAAILRRQYRSGNIVFVVGHDKIAQVFDPRYYADRDAALDALFDLATFRVAPRSGHGPAALHDLLARDENNRYALHVAALELDADVDMLSSTVVREAIERGAPWDGLVPPEVATFLREAQPYLPPVTLAGGDVIDPYGLRLALVEAAAAGKLDRHADFAALCRTARDDTPDGTRLRAWLGE